MQDRRLGQQHLLGKVIDMNALIVMEIERECVHRNMENDCVENALAVTCCCQQM